MPLQDVLGDGEAETRAACCARAALIDTVEALREPRDVLGGYADPGVGDGEVAAVLIRPPTHLDGAVRRRVFGGVVHQVGERGMDLGLHPDQQGIGIDAHPHFPWVYRTGEHILAQQREQRRHIDRLAADGLARLLQARELEQVLDDGRHALRLAAHLRDRAGEIAGRAPDPDSASRDSRKSP